MFSRGIVVQVLLLEQCVLRVEQFAVVQFHDLAILGQLVQVDHLRIADDADGVGFALDVLRVEVDDVVESKRINLRQVFLCRVTCIAHALDGAQGEKDGLVMRSCYLADSEEAWQDDAYVQQLVFNVKI